MAISRFEDIIAWQKSKELVFALYKTMKENRDYSFKDQLLRSAVSVMNNIAEGFERKGDKQFRNFLTIAKGSCGELRSMLYLAQELKYISDQDFKRFYSLSIEISKLVTGFIHSLVVP